MIKLEINTRLFRIALTAAIALAVVACDTTATTADSTTGEVTPSGIEYVITSSGATAYLFDGPDVDSSEHNPTITLQRGETYEFKNTTGTTHPFYIKFDDSAGSGNALGENDGVTGDATGTTIFEVPADAPDTLYYICSVHSGMAGEFTIVDQE